MEGNVTMEGNIVKGGSNNREENSGTYLAI
jgi:hypothetical protein